MIFETCITKNKQLLTQWANRTDRTDRTEQLTSQEGLGLGPGGGASRSVATEQRRQGPGLRHIHDPHAVRKRKLITGCNTVKLTGTPLER